MTFLCTPRTTPTTSRVRVREVFFKGHRHWLGQRKMAAMEARIPPSFDLLLLPQPKPSQSLSISEFRSQFSQLNTVLLSSNPIPKSSPRGNNKNKNKATNGRKNGPNFLSTSISIDPKSKPARTRSIKWLKPATDIDLKPQSLMKTLTVLERALIGAGAGGFAGAFTYFCLHPLDTIKTKLQTRGASEIYTSTVDAAVKTFQSRGIWGFYSGISAVIVGSKFSSAIYFGTCEFGKSFLSKFDRYPRMLIPPTAGAMGNIVSSAIMVPKELITQRMQAGAKGRSWQVLLKIVEKDGIFGLYAGYSATLLRNLPAGVLSYSSFEYLKAAVLIRKNKDHLDPIESVCCGALAGAISASLTTPLDVVKTRLMTQVASAAVYSGVSATVKQILMEEGWVGFTRGMGPRVVHSACFSAIGYFAFETARLRILQHYVKHKEAEELAASLA